MTKPRILSEPRPTGASRTTLAAWDRELLDATKRFIDYLYTRPVNSLSPEEWLFLDGVAPEIPI